MDYKKIVQLKQHAVTASNLANKTGNAVDHQDAIRANMDYLTANIDYDTKRLEDLEKELNLLLKDDLKPKTKPRIPSVKKAPKPMTKNHIKKSAPKKK